MKTTALRALNTLSTEQMSIKDLAKAIGLGYRMATNLVKDLLQQGYLVKSNGMVGLAPTAVATAYRKVSMKYDTVKLLGESREEVLLALLSSNTIQAIQLATGLSYSSIRRALDTLLETGVVKEDSKRYSIVEDQELLFFLTTLREEEQKRLVEPYAEVVYASHNAILKRVPLGKSAKGSLTGFSVFSRYGMEIRTVFQYSLQPERELSVEEVLVHAMVFSRNPVELTDCAVFYVKNKNSIDLGKLRRIAREFAIDDTVMDLENYIRNLTISSPVRFLPWNEFAEKARLYGVIPESLLPPAAFPDFFNELARQSRQALSLYIFGGEAMRINGLKRATKDVDIVMENKETADALREALQALGYKPLGRFSIADEKLKPSGIFVKENHSRVDLFVGLICNAFRLSQSMKERSETRLIDSLKVFVMSNEDIFLLKSITDREGDIYDMIDLAKSRGFNWRVVFEELLAQEEKTGRYFCLSLLDSIEIIEKKTSIRAPFYNKLLNHCIDQAILRSIGKWKATTLKQIKELVNYPDYKLRSRVNKLTNEGRLRVSKDGRLTIREPRENLTAPTQD